MHMVKFTERLRRTPTFVVCCEPGESEDQPNVDLAEACFGELVSELLAVLGSEVAP